MKRYFAIFYDKNSLIGAAMRGSVWTVFAILFSQFVRLANSLVLTRLLAPDLFGIITLASSILIAVTLFSDIGLHANLIRSEYGNDPVFRRTAWTIQVIRGFAIFLLCCMAAPAVSSIYNEESLIWILPIIGLNGLISGLNSTSISTLNKRMAIREITIMEIGSQSISFVAAVSWALLDASVWAILIGGLTHSAARAIWSHIINPDGRDGFAWNRSYLNEMFLIGRWILVSTALTFLATQADRLLIGALFPLAMLGVYGIALSLADVPKMAVTTISAKVLLPVFASVKDQNRCVVMAKILPHRARILFVSSLALSAYWAFGDIIVGLLYDERYADAEWIFPVLVLGVWPVILTQTLSPLLVVCGKTQYEAVGALISFIVIFVGVYLGGRHFGPFGAIVSVGISSLPMYVAVSVGIKREYMGSFRQDATFTALFVMSNLALYFSRAWLES